MTEKEYIELAKEGRRYFAEGRYDRALEVFDRILDVHPHDPDASAYRSRAEQLLVRKEY